MSPAEVSPLSGFSTILLAKKYALLTMEIPFYFPPILIGPPVGSDWDAENIFHFKGKNNSV